MHVIYLNKTNFRAFDSLKLSFAENRVGNRNRKIDWKSNTINFVRKAKKNDSNAVKVFLIRVVPWRPIEKKCDFRILVIIECSCTQLKQPFTCAPPHPQFHSKTDVSVFSRWACVGSWQRFRENSIVLKQHYLLYLYGICRAIKSSLSISRVKTNANISGFGKNVKYNADLCNVQTCTQTLVNVNGF